MYIYILAYTSPVSFLAYNLCMYMYMYILAYTAPVSFLQPVYVHVYTGLYSTSIIPSLQPVYVHLYTGLYSTSIIPSLLPVYVHLYTGLYSTSIIPSLLPVYVHLYTGLYSTNIDVGPGWYADKFRRYIHLSLCLNFPNRRYIYKYGIPPRLCGYNITRVTINIAG